MQWDGEGITEPDCPRDEQADIEGQKSQRHIGSCCTCHDEAAETRDQKSEPGDLSPLSWRDPAKSAGEYDDQREIRRVKDVLLLPANGELAADRNERSQRDDRE